MEGLKILLCALLALQSIQNGKCDKMTLDKLGQKLDTLGEKLSNFVESVGKIDSALHSLVDQYTLNILIDQCTNAINTRNEIGLNKIWDIIIANHNGNSTESNNINSTEFSNNINTTDPNHRNFTKTETILNTIIMNSYGGNRQNIVPLIRFISKTTLCTGYDTLYEEMKDYSHFYDGGEIFSLAHAIKVDCGTGHLFQKLPAPVRLIFTEQVSLKNTFNKGYLYRKKERDDNVMENQVATITRVSNATVMIMNYWRFLPSNDFAETFYIKMGNEFVLASTSRRLYFTHENVGNNKFLLELNTRNEISIGVELDDNRGGKKIFYRLYVQKQRIRNGEIFEVNLWTIGPKDEYYKYIFWTVAPKASEAS